MVDSPGRGGYFVVFTTRLFIYHIFSKITYKDGGEKMPVYEYECPACKKVFEVHQGINDSPLTSCSVCGGEVKKIVSMSSFHLKGGGWYSDGYTSNSSAQENSSDKAAEKKPANSTDSAKKKPPCNAADSACKGCAASS